MNRIRYHNHKYQVLITPSATSMKSNDFLLYDIDPYILHCSIEEYDSKTDAYCTAITHADIPWISFIQYHTDIFNQLHKLMQKIITENRMVVEFDAKLIDANTLKNIYFDKILQLDVYFKYGTNTIISFTLANPWMNNLESFSLIFKQYPQLRIKSIHKRPNKIIITGITDLGSVYEIILIPSILFYFQKWIITNKDVPKILIQAKNIYSTLTAMQDKMDKTTSLR